MKKPESPRRAQRKRTRGWKMPANTVSVSRPSPWGNPYEIRFGRPAAACVALFRQYLRENKLGTTAGWMLANIGVLRGKNLACWCAPDQPCHADVLLELANAESVIRCNNCGEDLHEAPVDWLCPTCGARTLGLRVEAR